MNTPTLKAGENPAADAAAAEHVKGLYSTGMQFEFAPSTVATRAFLDGFALGAENERSRAAAAHASLIASNTTLRRERSEARAEVAQLKGALALGQENCDAEYEELRRERDVARDGLRDSAKFNGELQAEIVRLTVDRDNWSNQAQTELRELAAAQARVKELEALTEAKYAQGYSTANRLNTKRREVDQAAYDELAALSARVAEMEALLSSEKATRNAIIAKGLAAEQRNAELEAEYRDLRVAYEQNASQCVQLNRELGLKIDTVEWLNGTAIQRERAEQAEARNAELEAALRETLDDPNSTIAGALYYRMEQVLARAETATPDHIRDAAQMVPPAKHPDTEPVRRFRIGLCQKCGEFLEHGHECDAARKEVQP